MANQSFPQIPASVWWGVRDTLQKSPNVKLEPGFLAAKLGVQLAAARQYAAELKRLGILDEDFKLTELGSKWRLDDSYRNAVESLASEVYPEDLAALSPVGNEDREAVKAWFMGQGLGQGSANNKASTYLLVTSPSPGENRKASAGEAPPRASKKSGVGAGTGPQPTNLDQSPKLPERSFGDELPALNVNIQIHISADATNEQIETIFSSMRKYLRDS